MSSSDDVTLKRYCTISGKIPKIYADKLKNYDISDPYTERFLEYCKWEEYRKKNAYHNCIAKGSDYYLSVKTKYTLDDLKNAIRNFTENDVEYPWHISQMNEKYKEMKTNILSIEEKKDVLWHFPIIQDLKVIVIDQVETLMF